MDTIILGTAEAQISVGALAQQLSPSGAEIRDEQGRVLAYMLPPTQLKWPDSFPTELVMGCDPRTPREQRHGITTKQLLEKLSAILLPQNPS